jgi:cell division protein FtsN
MGSFSQMENARQLRDRLAATYTDVAIVRLQAKDGIYYRVQLGVFSNRAAAEEQARELAQAGYPAIILEK